MSEVARFAVMMRRSAELKQRIAVELAYAVVAVVDDARPVCGAAASSCSAATAVRRPIASTWRPNC